MKKIELFEHTLKESTVGKTLLNNFGDDILEKIDGNCSYGYYRSKVIQQLYEFFLLTDSNIRKLKPVKQLEYIKKAKKIHGDNFNYDDVKFLDNSKIEIYCNIHKGNIIVNKDTHIANYLEKSPVGCKVCYVNSRRESLESYIETCSKIWDNEYSYENILEYKNATFKVPVTCKTHGIFYINASLHKNKCVGCGECYRDVNLRKNYKLLINKAKERLAKIKEGE